jgi:hypothetical protein
MPLIKTWISHSLYRKAKELGFSEISIRQAAELYAEEFFRMPSTIGDILEVLV